MSEIIKLSKTRINSFITCPYKYYLGYGLGIRPQRKNLKLVLGLATHKAIENYLIQGMGPEGCIQERKPENLVAEAWDEFTLETDPAVEAALEYFDGN